MTYDQSPIPGHEQVEQDRQRMRRTTFVHPTVEGEIVRREPAPLQAMPVAQPMERREIRQREIVTGTSKDRADGFVRMTSRLSTMTAGAVAAIWFLLRWALPTVTGGHTVGLVMVGVGAVLAALVMFFAVWTVSYLVHMATSPGGIDLFESWRTQKRIDQQNDALVQAYRQAHQLEDKRR